VPDGPRFPLTDASTAAPFESSTAWTRALVILNCHRLPIIGIMFSCKYNAERDEAYWQHRPRIAALGVRSRGPTWRRSPNCRAALAPCRGAPGAGRGGCNKTGLRGGQ
jgi:hypothetical protein